MFWRLAIVEELLAGTDGHVHAAFIRVGKLGRQSQSFCQSIKHLYPPLRYQQLTRLLSLL